MITEPIEKEIASERDISTNIQNIISEYRINKENESVFDDVTILGIEFYS
jgi:hypothetical protein